MVASFSGTESFAPGRYEGGGMRFLRFRRFLSELLGEGPGRPQAVFFEEVRRHAGTDAAHVYGGLLATLTALCEESETPYQGIPVGTVKKRATGRGNAPKEAMIEAARARWPGARIESHDQADALWVLECGLDELRGRGRD